MRAQRQPAAGPDGATYRRRLRSVGALVELGRRSRERGDDPRLDRQLLLSALGSTDARAGALFWSDGRGPLELGESLGCDANGDAKRASLPRAALDKVGPSTLPLDGEDSGRWEKWLAKALPGLSPRLCARLDGRSGPGLLVLGERATGTSYGEDEVGLVETLSGLYSLLHASPGPVAEEAEAGHPGLTELREAWPALQTFVGESEAIAPLLADLVGVAHSNCPVVLLGESGTGKELLARLLHELAHGEREPFAAINCGALPENLIESELFGHVEGSFTGAHRDRQGVFARAGAGTVFLDEVGELSPGAQVRLLRVLQEGRFLPVGAEQEQVARCRVVAATHRDLRAELEAGRFREDLFYRLHVFPLRVPPLRERAEDIPVLLRHFLAHHSSPGHRPPTIEAAALRRLRFYSWPGNVRELENIARALLIECRRCDRITDQHVVAVFSRVRASVPRGDDDGSEGGAEAVEDVGRWAVEQLRLHGFNVASAQRKLESRWRREGPDAVPVHSRSGLQYYLQGEALRALVRHGWRVEPAALALAGSNEDLPRVRGKLERLLRGAGEAWRDAGRSDAARMKALRLRFSKLPASYADELVALHEALAAGKLG